MPNYNASVPMPQADTSNAGKTGEQYGGYIGKIAGAFIDSHLSEQNKKKIDEYVMAYNNPNDNTIFAGLTGSLRTEKLSRLLQPLDETLAATYGKKAQTEKVDETKIAQNMEVVKAREAVPTTLPNPDLEAINAEIALIVDALQSMQQLKNKAPQPVASTTPPVDQTPVMPPTTPTQMTTGTSQMFNPPYASRYSLPAYTPPTNFAGK